MELTSRSLGFGQCVSDRHSDLSFGNQRPIFRCGPRCRSVSHLGSQLIDVERKWSAASGCAHELEQQVIGLGLVPVSPRQADLKKWSADPGPTDGRPRTSSRIPQPVAGYSAGNSASAAAINSAPLMPSARAIFSTAASVGMCSPRSIFPT